MKLTHNTLRDLYLTDLKLPDTFHGRSTPKVKHIGHWESIPAHVGPRAIDLTKQDVWFWSDQHFGHKNIIQYADRPFKQLDQMHESLISNYLAVVKPNDIVFWCGDIAFMQDPEINRILDRLPGYKIHIVGNHDFDRSNKLKLLNMDERHLCYALDVVESGMEFQLLITHYPMTNIPNGCHNVHGHIHQNIADIWNTNVSVEHTNYAPINLNTIIQLAVKSPRIKS